MTQRALAGQPWLAHPDVGAILAALAGGGAETRFVGGVVRDALAGRPVADLDLATTLEPKETMRRLAAAGINTAPTGLAHGTVTAALNGRGYEITTLRRDVATDGRHAKVAFTDDWREDAARRDFTINAMSADPEGRVYDYFGGMADLAAGRIRFVGDAETRVREDYLRILRFFRFVAWYGADGIDEAALAACRDGLQGLVRVSAERVRHELMRLLGAPDPAHALAAMDGIGALEALLRRPAADPAPLLAVERDAGRPPDPLLRLAALTLPGSDTETGADADALAERLRLSRAERRALAALAPPWDDLGVGAAAWRARLHRLGRQDFERRALLAAAAGEARLLPDRLAAAAAWRPRALPVKGKDLIALGLTAGPEVGAMMAALETFWIARDFEPDRAALLAEAAARIDGSARQDAGRQGDG